MVMERIHSILVANYSTTKSFSRLSNMELLRIISMILILVIHADFYSVPYSVPRWFVVEGADAGVNCFILISGYFGIHQKWKSFFHSYSKYSFLSVFVICSYFMLLEKENC